LIDYILFFETRGKERKYGCRKDGTIQKWAGLVRQLASLEKAEILILQMMPFSVTLVYRRKKRKQNVKAALALNGLLHPVHYFKILGRLQIMHR